MHMHMRTLRSCNRTSMVTVTVTVMVMVMVMVYSVCKIRTLQCQFYIASLTRRLARHPGHPRGAELRA